MDKSGDCWEWIAGKDNLGYGRFALHAKKRAALAHRVAYELLVGEIPEGLEIDHLCRNRACVNPEHLEAVPHRVNVQRGDFSPQGAAARQRWLAKTHCPKGHPYEGDNLYITKQGYRLCGECRRLAARRNYWERGGKERHRENYLKRRQP